MRERTGSLIDEFDVEPPPADDIELAEVKAFLAWAADNHFTFLGYREYELVRGDDEAGLEGDPRLGPGHPSWLTRHPIQDAQREGVRAGDGAARCSS